MSTVSRRIARRVSRDFPDPSVSHEVCRLLADASESERVHAAIVVAARGDLNEVRIGVALAATDFRDVLVNGGLAGTDWERKLERELEKP